jgi:hypothetical protein
MNSTWISFRGVQETTVASVLQERRPGHRAFVSPAANGWVTVYDMDCDGPNELEIRSLGLVVCKACCCPALALVVIDSSVLLYWLFGQDGELADKSFEGDIEELTELEGLGLTGDLERLAALAQPPVTVADVRSVLAADQTFREDNLRDLAALLGIVHAGYDYATLAGESDEIGEEMLPGWHQFIHVGGPDPRGDPDEDG